MLPSAAAVMVNGQGASLFRLDGWRSEEGEHLVKIVYVKTLCRRANVE